MFVTGTIDEGLVRFPAVKITFEKKVRLEDFPIQVKKCQQTIIFFSLSFFVTVGASYQTSHHNPLPVVLGLFVFIYETTFFCINTAGIRAMDTVVG